MALLRVLFSLFIATMGSALAQQCTYELEPNDTPATATRLTGAGPNMIAPASFNEVGALCLTGTVGSGDQDAFRWEVTEKHARHRWTLAVEGPRNGVTTVELFKVTFADNGVDVTQVEKYSSVTTPNGGAALSGEFLVQPGSYYLGVATSGAAGEFVVNVTPVTTLRYGAGDERFDGGAPREYAGAFGWFGPVTEELAVSVSIDEEAAARVWGLDLWAAYGSSPKLVLEGPSGVIQQGSVDANGRVSFAGLGLEAGDYTVRVVGDSGMVRLRLESQGVRGDGVAVEPNDDWARATVFALGSDMRATVQNRDDYYRIDVADADAGFYDLTFESADELTYTLKDETGAALMYSRPGVSHTGLQLLAGSYQLLVEGSNGVTYSMALAAGAGPTGGELEPNDYPRSASPLPANGQVRGKFTGSESDVYSVQIEGAAQRYRVQLVGASVSSLTELTVSGEKLAQARGSARLRLDDLLLMPGLHYFEVRGDAGEYALKAISLGEVEVGAAEATPASDNALTPAAAGAPVAEAAAAAEAPLAAVLEPGPPPPAGTLELEPNDDPSRAMRVVPGQVYVGRLTGDSDDYYRFYLADDQYVIIEVVPPSGAPPIDVYLSETGWVEYPADAVDTTTRIERNFLAGDHSFYLNAPAVESDGYYQLRMTLAGSLLPPVDAEPNDSRATASALPTELRWDGRVGEYHDDDYFRLPVFDEPTTVTLTLTGTASERAIGADLRTESSTLSFTERGDSKAGTPWRWTVPAGEQTYLRVSGGSLYSATVEFGSPPDPAQLLPRRDASEVAVTLSTQADALAAYWYEGQVLNLTAHVENRGTAPQDLTLAAASSHAAVRVVLEPRLTLAAGESRDVAVKAYLPSDMRDDLPLLVEVMATGPGGASSAAIEAALSCEALPVGATAYWPLPNGMLGKLDVLRTSFGAGIHGQSNYERRDLVLIDGRVGPGTGGYLALDHSPTYRLAGDAAVTLVGATLDPRSDAKRSDSLKAFRIETSLDGTNFTSAYQGVLKAAGIEQAFEFAAPVQARYARLVYVSAQSDRKDAYLGEWKLLAAEDGLLGEINLAARENGGHVAWSEPFVGSYGAAMLTPDDGRGSTVDLRDTGAFTFVVGFHENRAAQVTRIEWQEEASAQGTPASMFPDVTVEVSLTGGAGPWAPVADWHLERDATGLATLDFSEPIWARYLRFTAAATLGADGALGRNYYPPDVLRVIERAPDTEYRSALGEWGANSPTAIFEYLNPPSVAQSADDGGNDSLAQAAQLTVGRQVTGTVQVAVDEDWYRLTIPAGQNYLELTLGGDPAIAYRYEVVGADGRGVGFDERSVGDGVVLTLFGTPGDYYLHLWEPKRTVVFSWDTSGSVNPYQAITYNSLASFASGLDGEREAAQLLAFDDPGPRWLLPFWSTDPERVQRAIVEFDRKSDSSSSETALLEATKALADREGTRAILFMTDAESPSPQYTPELWRAFERVRPRIFTFEISSAGSDYAQDLMQDWADVNSGVYALAAGVGDFDAGFSRASCLLRRPKQYTLALDVRSEPLPGPGSLAVRAAPGAAQAAVEVIFDASGSMGRELPSGEQRITAAKRALTALVSEVLPEGTPFALRAFGHITPTSCESRLDLPLAPLDRAKAQAAVDAIQPKLLSQTPLADSLLAVGGDLAKAGGARTVILITDGAESCGGDPAAAVLEARKQGSLDLAIVSLGLEPEALAVFEKLAADVGASYVDVGSYEALAEAVAEALNPAYEVYDATTGELVARGRVGGEAIDLEMGVYNVRVLVAPVEEFREVRVPGEKAVTLTLSGH